MNKLKNNYKVILVLIFTIVFFIYVIHFLEKKPTSTEIKIGQNTIYAQIADTENKRSMGLSYTKELGTNAGMLFVFDTNEVKNFWMRDMNFDLDIIWIDDEKKVNGFFENVEASSYNKAKPELSKVYHSPPNTKYVLEVPAGTIENLKIKVGDVLEFKY